MPDTITRALPAQTRSADLAPSSWDETTGQCVLTWTTGAVVRRFGWDGDYDEELSAAPGACRIDRMNGGGPIMLDHCRDTASQVGAVIPGSFMLGADGTGTLTAQISRRDDCSGLRQDIADGIVRGCSVGYRILKATLTERDGQVPLLTATDWEPVEVSLVPIPADSGASVRSARTNDTAEITIVRATRGANGDGQTLTTNRGAPAATETDNMPDVIPAAAPAAATTAEIAEQVRAAVAADRTRATEIRAIATRVGVADVGERLVAEGVELSAARSTILDAVAERQAETGTSSIRVSVGRDEQESVRAGVENAILRRAGLITDAQITEVGRQYVNMSVLEMVRAVGGRAARGMSRDMLADAALSMRSDTFQGAAAFPIALSSLMNRAVLRGYQILPRTYEPFANVVEVADFRPNIAVQLGMVPGLQALGSDGVVALGTITDGTGESYKVDTYASRVALTRQLLINDDLGQVANLVSRYGARAARLESDLVWNTAILANPNMADGAAVFNTTRKNLLTGAALTFDSLSTARTALRNLKSPAGDVLNLVEAFIAVSPEDQTTAEKLIGAIQPTKEADVNPFASRIGLIVEPRLSGHGWFLIANPSMIDGLRIAYLQGARGLQSKVYDGREVLGLETAVWLDVAAKIVESRFAVYTPAVGG